jgi:hypothetical protein
MSCPTCKKVTCPAESSLPFYLGQYSLSNGRFFQNTSPISVPVTVAPGVIVLPPGAVQISVPTNPTSPFTFVVNYKGCQASYTVQIPPTQNEAFFNQVISALASQLGLCVATTGGSLPNGSTIPTFVNETQTLKCFGGEAMLLCNESLVFPKGVGFDSAGTGSLVMIAGIMSGPSVAEANAAAVAYLQTFLNNQITAGNMVCGGACPSCSSILAGLVWTPTNGSSGTGTASGSGAAGVITFNCQASGDASSGANVGSISFNTTFVNTTSSPCVYNVTLSLSADSTSCFSSFVDVNFLSSTGHFHFGGGASFNTFPCSFTVPANSSLSVGMTATASQAFECGGGSSLVGTVTIVLA